MFYERYLVRLEFMIALPISELQRGLEPVNKLDCVERNMGKLCRYFGPQHFVF